MIILTIPIELPNSVGGDDKISYDQLRFTQIVATPDSLSLNGQCQLTSSTRADSVPVNGIFGVTQSGILTISVEVIGFNRRMSLLPKDKLPFDRLINAIDNRLSEHLISLGLILGTLSE